MLPFTVHTLVRNEDRFIWFALNSVLPYVQKILVYDTGSTDKTVAVIKQIGSSKIRFEQKGQQTPLGLTRLRNDMITKTTTDWFLLLDGDEVWNKDTLQKYLQFTLSQPKTVEATFLRTRNCVGDIWHYLPEDTGRYEIANRRGNLNIRAFRKGMTWQGEYPLEEYDHVNNQPEHLKFFDSYYWHLTNLLRSSNPDKVAGFRRPVVELGIVAQKEELPEIFFQPRPNFIPDPLTPRSPLFELKAKIITPIKKVKRLL